MWEMLDFIRYGFQALREGRRPALKHDSSALPPALARAHAQESLFPLQVPALGFFPQPMPTVHVHLLEDYAMTTPSR